MNSGKTRFTHLDHREAPRSGAFLSNTLRQVLSAAIFEKMAIQSAFLEEIYQTENAINGNPLNLFIF
jgi:hypothetical protein